MRSAEFKDSAVWLFFSAFSIALPEIASDFAFLGDRLPFSARAAIQPRGGATYRVS
jgi:hypothetical protein